MSEEYIIVSDGDCHNYIIKYKDYKAWNEWCELDPEDENSWEVPEEIWHQSLDGIESIVFKEWRKK